MSSWWLVPLGVAAAGAVATALLTWRLGRRAEDLRRAMGPLRTSAGGAGRGASPGDRAR